MGRATRRSHGDKPSGGTLHRHGVNLTGRTGPAVGIPDLCSCGHRLQFDTDQLGRSVEVCIRCRYTQRLGAKSA